MTKNFNYSEPVELSSVKYDLNLRGGEGLQKVRRDFLFKGKSIKVDTPFQIDNIKHSGIYEDIEAWGNIWIHKACETAYQSVQTGGGPFGAIILQIDDETNEVLRYWEASNKVTEFSDPTAHAEVLAIRSACHSLGTHDLSVIRKEESKLLQKGETSHCEVYSSCEPCPMCYSAIYWARIPRLFFAATRFDAEAPGVDFSDRAIYDDLKVPYKERDIEIYQCFTENSLDAFNLWKNIEKEEY